MQNDKKLINNKFFKVSFFLSIGALVLFALASNYILHIGSLINIFYPCDDTILNSSFLHCYDGYDVYVSMIFLVIFIVSFLATISGAIFYYVNKRKKTN